MATDTEEALLALQRAEAAAEREARIEDEIARRSDEVARAERLAYDHKVAGDALQQQVDQLQGELKAREVRHDRDTAELQGVIKTLREEAASLTLEVGMKVEASRSWQKQFSKSIEDAEDMRSGRDRIKSEMDKKETEHTSMLQVLSKELEAAKASEARARKEIEKSDLTNQKDALLQKLFQEQLNATLVDLKHTKGKLAEAVLEKDKIAAQLKETLSELSDLRHAVGNRNLEYERRMKTLDRTNQDLTSKVKEGKDELESSHQELERLKEQFYDHVTEGRRNEQMQQKTQAQQKGEIKALQQKLVGATEDEERDRFEYLGQIEGLKDELQGLKRATDAEKAALRESDDAKSHQLVELKSEYEQLSLQFAQVSGQVKVSHTDATQKITSLLQDVSRLENEVRIAQTSYTQLQELSGRKESSLASELEAAGTQIASLRKEAEEREQKNKDAALLTWHEREGFKTQAAEKAKELDALSAEYAEFKLNVGTEMAVLRKREHDALVHHRAQYTSCESRSKQVETELTLIAGKFGSALESKRAAETTLHETSDAHTKIEQAMKAEISGYKDTVKKLEEEVLGNYDKKMLAAQNEELKETVQMFRNQISSLQHTVTTVRLEADIIESHKTKSLQDSNAECVKHVMDLQEQLDAERTLLAEIIPTLHALTLPTHVTKSIAAYQRKNESTETGLLLSSYAALALPIDGTTGVAE